jgi:putative redox protein
MGFTSVGPSGHEILTDADEESGGDNAGPRPTEAALAGVAGCSGIDVVWILQQMRLELEDLELEIESERAEEDPHRFTKIHIHYRLTGDLPESRVERAIDLTTNKYCSVSNSFNADITTSYEILNGDDSGDIN